MINGFPVKRDDMVFDRVYGWGKVKSVSLDGGCTVEFAPGKTFSYANGGFVGTNRRLYWKDPVLIDPPKNAWWWSSFVAGVQSLYSIFQNIPKEK